MNQTDLNLAVSRATGETVSTIKRLGFFLLESPDTAAIDDEAELGPYVIDWDELDTQRYTDSEGSHCEPAVI